MLISHSSRASDPVVMSRLIAKTMLQEIKESPEQSVSRISVVNMLRLLEMYRYNSFRARQPLGILEHARVDDLSTSIELDRLREAIASVHRQLLPNETEAAFSTKVGEVMVKLMPEDRSAKPADVSLVRKFLKGLTKALSAQPA